MAIATVQDVRNRWVRDFDEDEANLVETRLEDAERKIRRRIKDLDQRIANGDTDIEEVKRVEAEAVLRLIRNPEGFAQETDGQYSYQLNQRLASGQLEILDEEWEDLGVAPPPRSFILIPTLVRPQ